ncbi:type IV pilus biogenesis protein PilM [Schlesneria paludicola]|uniref:type IV pilus biogenesis protein PilM n=1 Tax=Schlesneria paludicola TaxID=360056 RepID=UPI000299D083|nr:hypothetical protein [Schlesneria paludicola]
MAEILALSWDRKQLSGLEVVPSVAGPRVVKGFRVDWPEQPPTAEWLRGTLQRFEIKARHVAIAIPREDVVLRLLELPSVPDDELPTLVRFQAAARTAQSIDQLLLDYLPLPSRPGVAQKEVWLATTSLATVAPIRSLLSEAGLDVVQLTLSSLCLSELIARGATRRSLDPAEASLVVLRQGARMELAVVCQQQLIAAHAVKWSSINEIPPVTKMLAEVSRVLVQVQAWLPNGTLQRAWVLGDDVDVGELPAAIQQRWNCSVERFDPWRDGHVALGSTKIDGASTEFAIATGLALIQSHPLTPKIDLLHPRQPPRKRDPRKPLMAVGAVAALVLTALAMGIMHQGLVGMDARIKELRTEDNQLGLRVKESEPTLEAAKNVEDWQSRNINQLNQIGELYQLMHGTPRVLVSEYKFSPGLGNVLGRLKTTGMAKSRADAEQLGQSLADLPKFSVSPSSAPGMSRDSEYVSRFELEADLVAVKLKPKPAAKPAIVPPVSNQPASSANPGQ